MPTIPEQLKQLRLSAKISQKDLGAKLKVPQSHISDIENGKVDPRLSSIQEMARVLDQEPILVPKALLPTVQALLSGKEDQPLWSLEEDDET